MSFQAPLLVFGAGGHAKVVIELLEALGYKKLYLLSQDTGINELLGYPIMGDDSQAADLVQSGINQAVIAIGDNRLRKACADKLALLDLTFPSLIHPASTVSPRASIGAGTVAFAGAVIQADSFVGEHVIINTRASLDHDNHIGSFAHIAPGATLAGGVNLGEGSLIGVGASVLPHQTAEAWTTVGGGAVVTNKVTTGSVVKGVPAC